MHGHRGEEWGGVVRGDGALSLAMVSRGDRSDIPVPGTSYIDSASHMLQMDCLLKGVVHDSCTKQSY